jgi:hypothetical protein
MKRFKIDAKLVSDVIMSIIMIPFLFAFTTIFLIGMIFHFFCWWLKNKI